MSSADRRKVLYCLNTWPGRYGFALATIVVAALIRYGLDVALGFTYPFSLFYPAIMLAALMGGAGPGVLATLFSGVLATYLFLEPLNSFTIRHPRDMVGLTLFGVMGIAISGMCDLFRRRGKRLEEFEKVVEDLEEMIVVVDRDYRCVIANRAFLKYRRTLKADLIGRRIPDLLNHPEAFETTVIGKLDECFRGKVVQFEMRYEYSDLGERDLFISYLPIEGRGGVDRVACVLQDVTERRRAEHAIEESEKRFRAVYEGSPIGIALVDPESGRFLEVNPKFCGILGRTEDEVLRLDFPSVTHPDDVEDSLSRRRKLRESETTSFEMEKRYVRPDGEEVWANVSVAPMWRDGKPQTVFLVMAQDITQRKRAEAELSEREDRYRDLVEHSQDLVCTHDLEGNLLSMNPEPARILGYEVDELLKIPMRELIAPECVMQFEAYLDRMKSTGADEGLLPVMTRSGERRIWEYRNTLRTDGVISPIVRGMARDVTERKRAEQNLQDAKEFSEKLIQTANVMILGLDTDGNVNLLNGAGEEITGYTFAELKGKKWSIVAPADRFPHVWEEFERLVEATAGKTFENPILTKTGDVRFIAWQSSAVTTKGKVVATISFGIDITEHKKAEEALRRREEDYRRFVAQTSEGIFREELDAPIPIDLSEDELVHHILYNSHMAECNDAIAKMYGFTKGQELVGKPLTEMLVADDARNIELTREYVRSGFRIVERESHEVDIDGNPKVFRNSVIGIVENGKLARTWGIQRDVTEQMRLEEARREAEGALQASETHFRLLVEQASDGIFIADSQGKYIDVNSAGAEMLGYTREEILRFTIADIIAPGDVPRLPSEVSRFAGGATVLSEWKFRRKDGSFFPGEVCGKQLPDGRLQGILRDISERRRAEETMRRNEERFRVALRDSPITVFNRDCELRYRWIYNPQPYWQHEVLGKSDEEILGPKKAARLTELKRRVLKTGVALRKEVVIPYEGRNCAFDVTIEPMFDAAGTLIGITGALMDIAQLREMTDRLQDAKEKLAQLKSYLEGEIQAELGFEEVIGQSPALREVLREVQVVAPTDSTVLLTGETGTGKELVARSLHALSTRRDKTFIKLNCAAVPSGLLESELFGHEKGAFTGAVSQKVGRIELADKGTLFLDEIGEMPIELQPKLLRVLQDREFERLGGIRTLHVDVRIISATNRDLRQDIADKKFREDLFYRLNVFPIDLPALRERRTDIPILIQHFVRKHSTRMGRNIDTIPEETISLLQEWNWPGNVRELENMIERMVILSKGRVLAAPPAELDIPQAVTDDNLREMKREHIIQVLRETGGVLSGMDGAASRLGIKRTTLQSMLKRHGIELQNYRRGNGMYGPR